MTKDDALKILPGKEYNCTTCGGEGWFAQQVSDTEQEQRLCMDCRNGATDYEQIHNQALDDCAAIIAEKCILKERVTVEVINKILTENIESMITRNTPVECLDVAQSIHKMLTEES